jgi:hypothetical protein
MGLLLLLASWLPIVYFRHSVWILIVEIVALDFAVQVVHVTNQSMIFARHSETTSRACRCLHDLLFDWQRHGFDCFDVRICEAWLDPGVFTRCIHKVPVINKVSKWTYALLEVTICPRYSLRGVHARTNYLHCDSEHIFMLTRLIPLFPYGA